jgi:putative holliday junction resolvase
MPETNLDKIIAFSSKGRLTAIDLGSKTIGLAASDAGWTLATPRQTLSRTRFTADAAALSLVLLKEQAAALIVGLPLNMDETEGPRAQSTRAFMRNFDRLYPMPWAFFDERLSTVAAEDAMREAGIRARDRARRIDAAAAAIILQGALDRLSR